MSVAKSYARALFGASQEKNLTASDLDQIEAQLGAFNTVLNDNKDLRSALFAPIATGREKAAIAEAVADKIGVQPLFRNLLSMLAQKDRLMILPDLQSAFHAIRLEATGGISGDLIAADPVSNDDVQGLSQAFSRKLGKRVDFTVSQDPSLLAGMKVTVNGVTYDGTLRTQLDRLRDRVVLGTTGQA